MLEPTWKRYFERTARAAALTALACIVLGALPACVNAPDGVAQLGDGKQLDQRSDSGLVDATVALAGPNLARGPNDFSVTLQALRSDDLPVLTSVDASMPAHGHHASTSNIAVDGAGFRIEQLDLFMSGRWQVSLGVELGARSDVVEFALDVP